MMFEQELYSNFSTYLPRPYFMTFAGDVSLLSHTFFLQFIACVGYTVAQPPPDHDVCQAADCGDKAETVHGITHRGS